MSGVCHDSVYEVWFPLGKVSYHEINSYVLFSIRAQFLTIKGSCGDQSLKGTAVLWQCGSLRVLGDTSEFEGDNKTCYLRRIPSGAEDAWRVCCAGRLSLAV